MKYLILLISFSSLAEKIYTQEEFDQRLSQEIEKIKKTSVVELTENLMQKQRELEQKEIKIRAMQDELQHSQKDLENRIAEFDKEQEEFLGCIVRNKDEINSRVKRLVEVISNMSAGKAADLISVQDPAVTLQLLPLLDTTKAAKIFNAMDKEKSAELQKLYIDMKK